jgi:phosphoribosylglycinamide formyltransferase-1
VKKRVAVFISGRGSNLKALIDENPHIDFYVYSNSLKAEGLSLVKRRGLFTKVLSLKSEVEWQELAKEVNRLKISKIFLLGFMKIVPASFLSLVKASCVNLHPSVLPSFPGLKAMERTFEAKKSMGCSLHEVTAGVDEGPLLLQKEIKSPLKEFKDFKNQVHSFEQKLVTKFFDLNFFSFSLGGL